MTNEHHRILLFDAGNLHGLDISADNFRAQEDFYLDVFLKHRWYSGNHKRDKNSILQAWNAFVQNVQNVGRDAWLRKLNTIRVRFESRTPNGVKYRLPVVS